MVGKIIEKLKKDELVAGSFILFIMINICNLSNQIFHLFMARFLGPVDYGTLTVLFSLIYILATPTEAVQNVIANYTARLSIKGEKGKIKLMLFKGLKKSFLVSIILFIFYLPLTLFLSSFLKIDYLLFGMVGILIFTIFSVPTLRGILQGQKKFFSLGYNMILESIIKLSFGIILVVFGLKVYGAIFAVIASSFISFLLAFFLIKDILKQKIEKENFKKIYSYSLPYLISIVAITFILSLDVVFAKKFFNPETAGIYSVASTFGKMIFFGIIAIGKAMLPLISEKHNKGEKTEYLLNKSLSIVLLISSVILLFFLIMPSIIINIFFGNQYLEASGILFIVGTGFTFLSLSNIVILYGLSVNKIKNSSFTLFFFVILEIIFFYLFHSSIIQYSIFFLIINFLMFLYSLFLIK